MKESVRKLQLVKKARLGRNLVMLLAISASVALPFIL